MSGRQEDEDEKMLLDDQDLPLDDVDALNDDTFASDPIEEGPAPALVACPPAPCKRPCCMHSDGLGDSHEADG